MIKQWIKKTNLPSEECQIILPDTYSKEDRT